MFPDFDGILRVIGSLEVDILGVSANLRILLVSKKGIVKESCHIGCFMASQAFPVSSVAYSLTKPHQLKVFFVVCLFVCLFVCVIVCFIVSLFHCLVVCVCVCVWLHGLTWERRLTRYMGSEDARYETKRINERRGACGMTSSMRGL